ncbi:RIO1 family regulatory kinase/ATPase domain-containing protein [Dictyoglomus thermophilum]|nr:RIO1 family regulatory kinase/ATPase [Dictyoglomus thermophilum]
MSWYKAAKIKILDKNENKTFMWDSSIFIEKIRTKRSIIYFSTDGFYTAKQYLDYSYQISHTDIGTYTSISNFLKNYRLLIQFKIYNIPRIYGFSLSNKIIIMENIKARVLSEIHNPTSYLGIILETLYSWDRAKLLHGDLSRNNILIDEKNCYIIDLDNICFLGNKYNIGLLSNILDFERKSLTKYLFTDNQLTKEEKINLLKHYCEIVSVILSRNWYKFNAASEVIELAKWYKEISNSKFLVEMFYKNLLCTYGILKAIYVSGIKRSELQLYEAEIICKLLKLLREDKDILNNLHFNLVINFSPWNTVKDLNTAKLICPLSFIGTRSLLLIIFYGKLYRYLMKFLSLIDKKTWKSYYKAFIIDMNNFSDLLSQYNINDIMLVINYNNYSINEFLKKWAKLLFENSKMGIFLKDDF